MMRAPSSAVGRLTAAVLGARIAYGLALVARPALPGRPWLGPAAGQAPTQTALAGLGGREVAVHGAALVALLRRRPLRPWLAVSLLGDLTDIAGTLARRRGLPERAPRATVRVAGVSALVTALLWSAPAS